MTLALAAQRPPQPIAIRRLMGIGVLRMSNGAAGMQHSSGVWPDQHKCLQNYVDRSHGHGLGESGPKPSAVYSSGPSSLSRQGCSLCFNAKHKWCTYRDAKQKWQLAEAAFEHMTLVLSSLPSFQQMSQSHVEPMSPLQPPGFAAILDLLGKPVSTPGSPPVLILNPSAVPRS